MEAHQRQYIRHPASIPIEVSGECAPELEDVRLNNVSFGGLSFISPWQFESGSVVRIKIPWTEPPFSAFSAVQWCRKIGQKFELGVRFLNRDDAYRVRMVEQVCHIEEYRKQEERLKKRRVTQATASKEWIEKYAARFPGSVDHDD